MEIGTIIKKYRRERDMTQEQLAEYLRVSVSAVSQWESGKTAPDLATIPAICNLFGVSADELLGIDREHKQEKIDEILENASLYSDRGYMTEAEKVLEAGLWEYPDSYDIMHQLMHNKFGQGNWDEAIRLGTRILEECTDDSTREGAKQILCYAYHYKGEYEKGLEIAKALPTILITREGFLPLLCKGNEAYHRQQNLIEKLFDMLVIDLFGMNKQLDDGSWAYTPAEMSAIREKQLALYELLFEDGNYGFYHYRLDEIHRNQASYYAEIQNAELALHHLSAAADHAIAFVMSEGKCTYTSLLLRGSVNDDFSTTSPDNNAKNLMNFMSSPVFDFLRDTPEFAAILARLEPVAGKWKVKE